MKVVQLNQEIESVINVLRLAPHDSPWADDIRRAIVKWLLEQPQLEVTESSKVELGDIVERRISHARSQAVDACLDKVNAHLKTYDRLALDALPDDEEDTTVTAHAQRAKASIYDTIVSALCNLSKDMGTLKTSRG